MTTGPLVMPILEADPDLTRRVVKRVIEWDRITPDPFRERDEAKSGEIAKRIADINDGLARLPDQLHNDPARARARQALDESGQQIKAAVAQRCGPGTLDPEDADAATERIKSAAQSLALTHPFVLAQAGGEIKSVSVGTYRIDRSRLPIRLTVSINPVRGKAFCRDGRSLALRFRRGREIPAENSAETGVSPKESGYRAAAVV